jgi:predicted flap endonuclease-1-like 5' DNA nuclease
LNLTEVEGIGPEYAAELADAGIITTETLLERGATPRGRTGIEAATGISGKLILEWINHADLMRIDGVGSEYADLLEAAGVDSPAELAHRNPANLATTFQEINAARPDWIRRVPSEATVAGWIEQAKAMDRSVSHVAAAPGPAPAPAAAPAPGPARPPAPAAGSSAKAAAAPKSSAKPEATGLLARIKRLFGGG